MTIITLELDPEFHEKLEVFASKHGQSLTDTAYYLLNKGYEVEDEEEEEEDDRPYNPEFVKAVLEAAKRADNGEVITMSYEEWKRSSNEIRKQYK